MPVETPKNSILLEEELDIIPAGLKLRFNQSVFLDEYFDGDDFVLQQQKLKNSLQEVQNDLLQYSTILKNGLVELINRDYAIFVNLSTHLVGLEKLIERVERPLEKYLGCVAAHERQLTELRPALDQLVAERQALAKKTSLLFYLQTVHSCIERLERWLESTHLHAQPVSLEEEAAGDRDQLDELEPWPERFRVSQLRLKEDPSERVDRICNEYIKLQHFSRKCHNHPMVESLATRIDSIDAMLCELLENRLIKGLEQCFQPDEHAIELRERGTMLHQALLTFAALDKPREAERLIRKHVYHSRLAPILTASAQLTEARASAEQAGRVFELMLEQAFLCMEQRQELLNACLNHRLAKSYDPLAEFDFIGNAFWPETVELLIQVPELFGSGNPDKFQRFYTLFTSFLRRVQNKLASEKQKQALESSPLTKALLSRWNLPVYFQMRNRDCTRRLDQAMSEKLAVAAVASIGNFQVSLAQTEEMVKEIHWLWSESVFIDALRHRFLKLTIQLVKRYVAFLKEGQQLQPTSSDARADVFRLISDGQRVSCYLGDDGEESLLARTVMRQLNAGDVSDELHAKLRACFSRLSREVHAETEQLVEHQSGAIHTECLVQLRQMMDIPRAYRRMNKDFAKSPSAYVTNLVKLFDRIVGETSNHLSASSGYADENLLHVLLQSVTRKTVISFFEAMKDLLTNIRKAGDTLRKFREARHGATTEASSNPLVATDDDKMRHQLSLDARTFVQYLRSNSAIDAKAIEELNQLAELAESAK